MEAVGWLRKSGLVVSQVQALPARADAEPGWSWADREAAEQVLNHILPALAEVEPGVKLKPGVEYVPGNHAERANVT